MLLRSSIELEKVVEKEPSTEIRKKIWTSILNFLEKRFGAKILLEIPSGLQQFSEDLFPALEIAGQLKKIGIINEIIPGEKIPDEPFVHKFKISSVGRAHGMGADFFSRENSLWKALGEVIERYLWYHSSDFYSGKIVRDSFGNLREKALDIFSLAGFSDEQKKEFSDVLSFDNNTSFAWIPAYSLTEKKEIFCPLQLAGLFYYRRHTRNLTNPDPKKEPLLRWSITTGMATGRNFEEAVGKGILEAIERDAFMIAYLNKISPPVLDLDYISQQDAEIADLLKKFKRYDLEVHFVELPSDFPVFVISAIIIDRTGAGPAFMIGARADFDLKTCLLQSLAEAHSIRLGIRKKMGLEKRYDDESEKVEFKNIDIEDRILYWSYLKNLPKLEFMIKGNKKKIRLSKNFYSVSRDDDPKKYYAEKLKILTRKLKNLNYEACAVELTTNEIKKLGFRSVQVIIPQLHPLHLDESIPYFSSKRLTDIPRKFGYTPAEKINMEPHPFP